jgi:hypothetical protein
MLFFTQTNHAQNKTQKTSAPKICRLKLYCITLS